VTSENPKTARGGQISDVDLGSRSHQHGLAIDTQSHGRDSFLVRQDLDRFVALLGRRWVQSA
jgi:hypothetical protein